MPPINKLNESTRVARVPIPAHLLEVVLRNDWACDHLLGWVALLCLWIINIRTKLHLILH